MCYLLFVAMTHIHRDTCWILSAINQQRVDEIFTRTSFPCHIASRHGMKLTILSLSEVCLVPLHVHDDENSPEFHSISFPRLPKGFSCHVFMNDRCTIGVKLQTRWEYVAVGDENSIFGDIISRPKLFSFHSSTSITSAFDNH